MGIDNKEGWKLGTDSEEKQGNPKLFVILVNMNSESNDYYSMSMTNWLEECMSFTQNI